MLTKEIPQDELEIKPKKSRGPGRKRLYRDILRQMCGVPGAKANRKQRQKRSLCR